MFLEEKTTTETELTAGVLKKKTDIPISLAHILPEAPNWR